MPEGIVKANGIDIWYEMFGDPSHATVLLIQGAYSQAFARKMHFMSLANPGVAYNLDHIAAIEWDIKDAPEGGAVMEKQVQKAAIGFQTP